MDRAALADRISRSIDGLAGQMGAAARYVLDNPGDVALLSMREQARRAGVQPWTMTRLAQRLGFDGYDALRELHGRALKEQALGFAGRAGRQVERQRRAGGHALAREIADAMAAQLGGFGESGAFDAIADAAKLMARARRIFCLGLRSSAPVAAHFAYMLSFLGEKPVLLDRGGGDGLDPLRFAIPERDAFFVVTVAPYTRASVEAARHAAAKGLPVVALTDSVASPVARLARHAILVSTESPSFFHSMTPAFTAAEILAALIAGEGGEEALAAISRTERHLSQLKVHVLAEGPKPRRRGKE